MLRTLLASAATLALAAPAFAATPQVKTVFVIALENHNFTQPSSDTSINPIFGNPAAPYINSLITPGNANAAQVSYATNYHNVIDSTGTSVHPSEPNYVWAEAGVHGPLNDAQPYPANIVNAPNLSARLAASGQSWRSYQEDTDLAVVNGQVTSTVVPTSQYTVPLTNLSGVSSLYTNPYNGSNQYNYAAKHNPQVFFTATNGNGDPTSANPQAQNYAPLQQLAGDLTGNKVAQYNWISPDQYNDMHTALSAGFTYNGVHYTGDEASIAQGDNFLSMIIPEIMASQAYKDDGAIVIWNDETEGETPATYSQYASTEIVISPLAKGNAYAGGVLYDHSSDLRTMEEIFGLDPAHGYSWLGGSAGATDLSDLFVNGAIPVGVPEPATWTLMIGGFGVLGLFARRRRAIVQA